MDKFIYDNSNGLWYELHGECYLPCLIIPETENQTIGVWGRKHREYLREHRPAVYADLVLSGGLFHYLAEVDAQARTKFDLLVAQLVGEEEISEQLKAQNQMAWVRAMNSIRNRAEEVINAEVIYA